MSNWSQWFDKLREKEHPPAAPPKHRCGKPMSLVTYTDGRTSYRCEPCKVAKRLEVMSRCNACGRPVPQEQRGRNRRWCSDGCRQTGFKLKQLPPVIVEGKATPTVGLRFSVLERDGFRCRYCGASADDGIKLHVDHIQPRSKGGTNQPSNLVTACANCNLGKSNRVLNPVPCSLP